MTIRADATRLVVEVRDDGRGFAPETAGAGFGLAGMRERALQADGRLTITSNKNGTTVTASLPLSRPLASAPMESAITLISTI